MPIQMLHTAPFFDGIYQSLTYKEYGKKTRGRSPVRPGGVLYADRDMAEIAQGKFDFDVVGHYARADVFKLRVNEEPLLPVVMKEDE